MPEIIEVQQYTNFIKKYLLDKQLKQIKIIQGRYKKHGPPKNLNLFKLPTKLINIQSKGKFMYMSFDNNMFIGFTLGLTGGWFYNKQK